MFTTKQVHIIDKSVVRKGSLVTFSKMSVGDNGEYDEVDYTANGVIYSVEEEHFYVATGEDNLKMRINSIVGSPAYDGKYPVYQVWGIADAVRGFNK